MDIEKKKKEYKKIKKILHRHKTKNYYLYKNTFFFWTDALTRDSLKRYSVSVLILDLFFRIKNWKNLS